MSETIVTEDGQIKIQQQQATPLPIKTGLANGLRQLTTQIDKLSSDLVDTKKQLDRVCDQLLPEHWETLVLTQIKIIAVLNTDAADYLKTIGE